MHLKDYLTSGEAVEYLENELNAEVHYYDLDNLIRADAIEPPKKIGGRRLWSHEDLKNAKKALRRRRIKRPNLTKERSLINQQEDNDE